MNIRRFRGKTVHAALEKAKRELGPEAVLMHTKSLKGPRVGGETIEIIVGVDREIPSTLDFQPRSAEDLQKETLQQLLQKTNSVLTAGVYNQTNQQPDLSAVPDPAPQDVAEEPQRPASLQTSGTNQEKQPVRSFEALLDQEHYLKGHIGAELSEIRGILHILMQNVRQDQATDLVETVQGFYQTFLKNEIDPSLAYELAKGMEACFEQENLSVHQHLAALIQKTIQIAPALRVNHSPAVVAFVGPTGVGKTTTLAKLAAYYHLKAKRKVVLLTIDNYRIAAAHQLRTYAEILSVPFNVAQTPEELQQQIDQYQEADLILLDTPGRSQLDILHLRETEAFLNAARPHETHLLVSANTRNQDVCSILEQYGSIGVNRLIFTKLDETNCFGTILNACMHSGKPISYFTTGQDVAGDIERPKPMRLAGYLLRGFRK